MQYLTSQQIKIINQILIHETGGSFGVRDNYTISSLEFLPQQTTYGEELYKGVFVKGALYIRNIIMNHPFLDGNKRTGMACGLTFLELNNYKLIVKDGEIEDFAVKVVIDKLELKDIANWLEKNSQKIEN